MTYIDYWNQLWKIAEVVPLTSSEVALDGSFNSWSNSGFALWTWMCC